MNTSTCLLVALSLAALSAAAPAQQQATQDLRRVEISGRAVRHDVSRVCPGVANALQDSLAYTAYREDRSATLRVNFQLSGSQLDEVKATDGTREYREAVRRAVRSLDCMDAASASQPQQFSFLISFRSERDAALDAGPAPASRVALLEER
ncbi:hypothetical protein [Pelomonas sp. KK5]|uniref:hypothetical protein n=1 Tax=Pelomonas sp. KK5 TaxID=1855730 RepID=UPI00097C2B3D|nr:hypothetical protein [Pelomonas sp. KK5]